MLMSTRGPCLALAIALAGCDSPEKGEPRLRVGQVADTEAFVGIAMDDDRVFAYVCDGTPASTTLSAWFVADSDGAGFSAANPSGATLEGEDVDGVLTGRLRGGDGVSHDITAMTATGRSGLYFGELDPDTDDEAWGGWI